MSSHAERDRVWAALRAAADTGATVREIARRAEVGPVPAGRYLQRLVRGGFAARADDDAFTTGRRRRSNGVGDDVVIRLVRDVGVIAPRLGADGRRLRPAANDVMWAAMMAMGTWTIADLKLACNHAETGRPAIPDQSMHRFMSDLRAGGFITVGASPPKLYVLLPSHQTGPRAPLVTPDGVFDRNTGRLHRLGPKGQAA